jgi:hypothetical protein
MRDLFDAFSLLSVSLSSHNTPLTFVLSVTRLGITQPGFTPPAEVGPPEVFLRACTTPIP